MRNAPIRRDPFRPMRSTRNTRKKKQETTLQTPKKPLSRRAFFPAPTALKICGETVDVSRLLEICWPLDILTVGKRRVAGQLDTCISVSGHQFERVCAPGWYRTYLKSNDEQNSPSVGRNQVLLPIEALGGTLFLGNARQDLIHPWSNLLASSP